MLISIVVPVYNEEENIRTFYDAVTEVMSGLEYDHELIYVDDGSQDRSREILHGLEKQDERVQSIFLAHQQSLSDVVPFGHWTR